MTIHLPWEEFEGAPAQGSALESGLLEMHGRVSAVRVTYYPGVALPHIEVWTDRPGCDPDFPSHHYFNAFAPVRQDQTDDEWLALLLSGDSTVLQPPKPTETETTEESP